jgi:hypothetical protein
MLFITGGRWLSHSYASTRTDDRVFESPPDYNFLFYVCTVCNSDIYMTQLPFLLSSLNNIKGPFLNLL